MYLYDNGKLSYDINRIANDAALTSVSFFIYCHDFNFFYSSYAENKYFRTYIMRIDETL